MAWDGSGNTYCTALPVCATGQVLTSLVPGQLSCVTLVTQTSTITNTSPKTSDYQPTIITTDVTTNTPTDATSESTCTAYPEVCVAYAAKLGRLPDAGGAAYYQNMIDNLVAAFPNVSAAELQRRVENDITYTLRNYDSAAVISSIAAGPYGLTSCSGATNCAALAGDRSGINALRTSNYDGPPAAAAVVDAANHAVSVTRDSPGSAAAATALAQASNAQRLAAVETALSTIVGHDIPAADKQWFADQLSSGAMTIEAMKANMQDACRQYVGTPNACK